MKNSLKVFAAFALLILVGCDNNESKRTPGGIMSNPAESLTRTVTNASIPAHWSKIEQTDPMSNKVDKMFQVESNESPYHKLSIACATSGSLNFYFDYPSRSGLPSNNMGVSIRIDNETFEESWYVGWINGSTRVKHAFDFSQKIYGKKTLGINILAATNNSFNIAGVERVIAEMEATQCTFSDRTVFKQLPLSELPKFAAVCRGEKGPAFTFVTDPKNRRIFFSRWDRQYDPAVSSKIKLLEKTIEVVTTTPCCDTSHTLQFDRRTGVLVRSYTRQTLQCERLADELYSNELTESLQHYNRKLSEHEEKKAAENFAAEQKRQEQITREIQPNKF